MSYIFQIVLDKVKDAIQCKHCIDDPVDGLNRTTMSNVMLVFATFSTFNQLIGHNIRCHGFTYYSVDFAEDYCWTQGIYTNRKAYNMPRSKVPYPGVVPCAAGNVDVRTGKLDLSCDDKSQAEDRVLHLWYQWTPFYFIVVAMFYYLPYLVLKVSKISAIKPVIALLKDRNTVEEHPNRLVKKISAWMYNEVVHPRDATMSQTARCWQNSSLVVTVIVVKMLYLGVSIFHFYATGLMFKIGSWTTYGMLFLAKDRQYNTNVKDVLFPKMASCKIVRWGPTGQEAEHGMCILAPNVTNQYLFLIMWYLNVILIVLNTVSWIYATFRYCYPSYMHMLILNTTMMQEPKDFNRLFTHVGPSGQIILEKLSNNMSGYILSMVSARVTRKLDKKKAAQNTTIQNLSNMKKGAGDGVRYRELGNKVHRGKRTINETSSDEE